MSILSENMRYLRGQLKCSQLKVAEDLMITRGRYAKYEDGASEPPLELLMKISRYFHVSIDLLLSVDLRRISLKQIMELPDNRILLPIAVDGNGDNKIEIIPHKASMGYLNGYSDAEYIESLQNISLPFLGSGKYRAFPADGDSMPPHADGSFIVAKYVEKRNNLKIKNSYVFVTRNAGITFKRLTDIQNKFITVAADNSFYQPYNIKYSDILEIWEYSCSIGTKDLGKLYTDTSDQNIIKMLHEIKTDLKVLRSKK